MKLGIFTTCSSPISRGDLFRQALDCYADLADEFWVVDGKPINKINDGAQLKIAEYKNARVLFHKWPVEFSWEFIGRQFQRGYEASTGDWVIHADLDFLFHERDFNNIHRTLKLFPEAPAVSFWKYQFYLPDRYNVKSRLVIAVNKRAFGNRIRFDSGGDLCQPSLDGLEIKPYMIPEARIPIYNYEKLTKTREQVIDDVGRMDRAYQRHFGKWLYSEDGTPESAFDGWMRMAKSRFLKPSQKIELTDHPIYIQETIKNLTPDHFGFSGFGLFEVNQYAKDSLRQR